MKEVKRRLEPHSQTGLYVIWANTNTAMQKKVILHLSVEKVVSARRLSLHVLSHAVTHDCNLSVQMPGEPACDYDTSRPNSAFRP